LVGGSARTPTRCRDAVNQEEQIDLEVITGDSGEADYAPARSRLLSVRNCPQAGRRIPRRHELPDDLRHARIANQRLRPGVAESAGQRAADTTSEKDRLCSPAFPGRGSAVLSRMPKGQDRQCVVCDFIAGLESSTIRRRTSRRENSPNRGPRRGCSRSRFGAIRSY
jgi:hypothetical protein